MCIHVYILRHINTCIILKYNLHGSIHISNQNTHTTQIHKWSKHITRTLLRQQNPQHINNTIHCRLENWNPCTTADRARI